jgi:AbrB family looped-hinge helix DNA binding protein
MKEMRTVMTRKGQVTVPAEIRRQLGLRRGDKVTFVIHRGEVRVKRTGSVVERTAGAFRARRAPLTAEELRQAAERAMAEEAVERMAE